MSHYKKEVYEEDTHPPDVFLLVNSTTDVVSLKYKDF